MSFATPEQRREWQSMHRWWLVKLIEHIRAPDIDEFDIAMGIAGYHRVDRDPEDSRRIVEEVEHEAELVAMVEQSARFCESLSRFVAHIDQPAAPAPCTHVNQPESHAEAGIDHQGDPTP